MAKIKLSEEEKQKYTKDLSSILAYVGKLAEISQLTASLKLESGELYPKDLKSQITLRSDQVMGIAEEELAALLSLFPDKEDRLIKSKPVFK